MNETILSYCDTKQVNSIIAYTVTQLQKTDWSADAYLSEMIPDLADRNKSLNDAIGIIRENPYTQKLFDCDLEFDKDWVCTKQFVLANRYSKNEERAENAEYIWKLIDSHDVYLHKMGYEKEIEAAKAFFSDVDQAETKARVDSLVGVREPLEYMRTSLNKMIDLFYESKEMKASRESIVAPSVQKDEVREIMNSKLFPYLGAMAIAQPDVYGEIARNIFSYVKDVNDKARSRTTRKDSKGEVVAE